MAIVRHEQDVIARMLTSAANVGITEWVIVDTGRGDQAGSEGTSTSRVAHAQAREHKASLHYRYHKWRDFSDARNCALRIAQGIQGVDYWLSLDADEEVLPGPIESMLALNDSADLFHLPLYNEGDGLNIWAARLIRHGASLKWTGKVHEGLGPEKAGTFWEAGRTTAYRIVSHQDGWRTRTGVRDQQTLELALAQLEGTPDNPRHLFYAACAVENSGDKARAIEMFERRRYMKSTTPLGEEEGWYAQFRAAYIRAVMGDHTAPYELLAAYARRPWRTEPLAVLAFFWRQEGQEELAKMLFPRRFPWPVSDWLFVDRTLYGVCPN